jgi:hypothetical protein
MEPSIDLRIKNAYKKHFFYAKSPIKTKKTIISCNDEIPSKINRFSAIFRLQPSIFAPKTHKTPHFPMKKHPQNPQNLLKTPQFLHLHYNMHKRVCDHAKRDESQIVREKRPHHENDNRVVVDVQKIERFALQNEQNRIDKLVVPKYLYF